MPSLCPPFPIPDHELLRRIGRGGYGEVWLARNALGAYRAVKIVRRENFEHDRPFEREFAGIQKFEPVSRQHEGLVDLLQVGRNEGWFYYVMELADDAGENPKTEIRGPKETRSPKPETNVAAAPALRTSDFALPSDPGLRNSDLYSPKTLRSELKRHGPLSVDRCLEIARALAGALAHLHARGLVHRDVKPSNIIFVGGIAKLADIGLVAAVDDSRSFVGTEGYIPPEGPGTASADCYALGKLLYELSTGHDRQAWPEPSADLSTRPDRERLLELNSILHQACAPRPNDRYRNADAMLKDVDRLGRGTSVRRAHRVAGYWKATRRMALGILAGAAAFALLVLASRWGQRPGNVEADKRSTNQVANDLYDIGRSHYVKNTQVEIDKAAENYQAAVQADPNFALAWAALAAAWCWGGFDTNLNFPNLSRAKECAERALQMDAALSEAHLTLALHAYIREWDWPKAEANYQKAIRCDPSNPQSHEWYALFLRSVGRTHDALREIELAVNQNPHSTTANRFLVGCLISARRLQDAVGRARKSAELSVDYTGVLPEALLWNGEIEEWITANERLSRSSEDSAAKARSEAGELKRALNEQGLAGFWNKRLEIMKSHGGNSVELAGAYAAAGHVEEALDLLDQAYSGHLDWLVWDLATHPQWNSLRDQLRFQELLGKLRIKPEAGPPTSR